MNHDVILSSKPVTQRLFFALWPPEELGRELHRLARDVLRDGAGRCVDPGNIHLTLAFLGSVDAAFRECAERAAAGVHAEAFTLRLEDLGYWPKPGILWVGPRQTPPALLQLVRALTIALADCGYEAERRPYAAHLTLARRAHPRRDRPSMESRVWEVDRFHLVRSPTHAPGARYEILRSWPLSPRPA